MADNTAQARKSIDKYRRYPGAYDKETAPKTIRWAQDAIRKLQGEHPSLRTQIPPTAGRPEPSAEERRERGQMATDG